MLCLLCIAFPGAYLRICGDQNIYPVKIIWHDYKAYSNFKFGKVLLSMLWNYFIPAINTVAYILSSANQQFFADEQLLNFLPLS